MAAKIFYGWIIVATLSVVNFAAEAAGGLNLGLFIIPMCEDLGFSRSIFGWMTTGQALSAAISSVFLGMLLDRYGPRIMVPVTGLITGLCMIGMSTVTGVYSLFFLFAFIGFAGLVGTGGPILTSVPIAKWFVRRRGLALSITSLGTSLGPVILFPITQTLIDDFGWRRAWLILALICMTLIILPSLLLLRRQPEDMGLLPDGDNVSITEGDIINSPQPHEPIWSAGEAMRTSTFWFLLSSLALVSFGMGGSLHRIPYLIEMGFDHKLVSLCFSADAASATLMILIAGFLLDRLPPRFIAAGSFAGFTVAITLLLVASTPWRMFASGILFGSSVGVNLVCQTYLWASYYGRAFLGSIRGATLPPILIGRSLGAPMVGYIYDIFGSYNIAWKMLIGVHLFALVIILFATPPGVSKH
ncbi:MAG: MFS transporter [Deltaproteobacteria bacterium]|nr:MFS transporter [Deltaproteobacteria bacterium]